MDRQVGKSNNTSRLELNPVFYNHNEQSDARYHVVIAVE